MSLDRLAGFAILYLRLSPDESWRLRFRDLAACLRLLAAPAQAPGKGELRRLMRMFPDISNREPNS